MYFDYLCGRRGGVRLRTGLCMFVDSCRGNNRDENKSKFHIISFVGLMA